MRRKLIYLDFDGVLHPTSAYQDQPFCQAPLLAQCLVGIACEIVITSSWRHSHSMREIRELLPQAIAKRIVGATGTAQIGQYARFEEIQRNLRQQPDWRTISWRALDDAYWEFPPGTDELIRCNPNTGLEGRQIARLRDWLSAESER